MLISHSRCSIRGRIRTGWVHELQKDGEVLTAVAAGEAEYPPSTVAPHKWLPDIAPSHHLRLDRELTKGKHGMEFLCTIGLLLWW